MALPLTRQLSTDTDLRRWFELRFSKLDAVTGDFPKRIRSLVPRRRPDAIPPWLMGMAFDWRLRLGIEIPADPWTTTAFAGWMLAFRSDLAAAPIDESVDDPVTELFAHAVRHGGGSSPGPPDEMELARISVALALYESWYRGGVRRDEPLFAMGPRPEIARLVSLCPVAAAEEMTRLVQVARRGLSPVFPATDVELNPVFDAHGIPADGDLVIDGLLLDLKTVTRPKIQLEWLWQMIGYVMLDGGRRELSEVGLYLSRHGWLQVWPLETLLSQLAGTPVTFAETRQEFLSVVRGYGISVRHAAESPPASWEGRTL